MNHSFKISLCTCLLLFSWIHSTYSQQTFFKKVAPPDGKTFVHVTGITQDANGYMWLATKNGLYRYDGYQMITYKNNPLDPNSLASDILESISVDSTGFIWIGTNGAGLDRFDPSTGIFKHFRHNPKDQGSLSADWVSVVMTDHEGICWVGSGRGLDRYNVQTGTFKHSNKPGDSTSISSDEVNAIYEDRQRTIWIGTGSVYSANKAIMESGGLNRMNKKTGTFTRYMHDPHNPNSLINNKVRAIFEDSKGIFWVGTAGDGLHTMDRVKGSFTRHQFDPAHPEKLSRPPINKDFSQTDHITFIREDAAGALWIGTAESGINYYDPKTTTTTHFESGNNAEGAFTARTAWWAYTSRDGVVWISTLFGDLYRINPLRKEIPHYDASGGFVSCFYREPNRILWLGTGNGIIRKDSNNAIIPWNSDEKNLAAVTSNGKWTSFIKEDNLGNVWIGGSGGLIRWDTKKKQLTTFINDPKNTKSLSNNAVITFGQDREGNVWIGTSMGLNLLDQKTGSLFGTSLIQLIPPYTDNFITAILPDKNGRLWTGNTSGAGLNLFNRAKGEFENYLKVYEVRCIFEDSNAVIWVGSNDGLYQYDRGAGTFIRYKDVNTLSEISSVVSIIEDNQRNLWIGTSKGIVRINPQRNETSVYNKGYGISENGLINGACYKGLNGEIYFGDETGYYSFNPAQLTNTIRPPEILITAFSLADQLVQITW